MAGAGTWASASAAMPPSPRAAATRHRASREFDRITGLPGAVQAALASIRADPKFALFAPAGALPDWRVDEVRSRDQLPDPLVQPDWVYYAPEENGRAWRWILGTALAAIILALLILLPWIRRLLAD